MAATSDPYAQLGVPRGATLTQIKAAHRALAKRYHPDSPTADAKRFLRVQEAYQLLTDPLRRREWDARHAPLRADQPAAPGRTRRAAAAGERRRTPAQPPRETPSRSYTWSAGDVPWWEDGSHERRRSGRPQRRAAAADDVAAGTGHAPRREANAQPAQGDAPRPAQPPADDAAAARNDFDVYSRSSGAAWSSAARAYFRRADQDLPRRGSFHRQGSQPLTAARARAAAEEEARRNAARAQRDAESPRDPGLARPERPATPGAAPRPAASAPARAPKAATGEGATNAPPRRAAASATERSTAAGGFGTAQPAYAYAGVAHDAEDITAVRQMARERERAARWPSVGQRVRFALLAWLPIALLIGYGAPYAVGCGESGACPPSMATGQALTASAALVLLLMLPRLAYVAGVASTGVMVAGGAALLLAWLMGVRPPQAATLPGWAIAGGAIVLLSAYLVTATWLLTDRRRLPWVHPPSGPR